MDALSANLLWLSSSKYVWRPWDIIMLQWFGGIPKILRLKSTQQFIDPRVLYIWDRVQVSTLIAANWCNLCLLWHAWDFF
jgi:hypothetical protein